MITVCGKMRGIQTTLFIATSIGERIADTISNYLQSILTVCRTDSEIDTVTVSTNGNIVHVMCI